ncbi:uncharacterized protein LOC117827761 isoform X2 [Xyrichtys novacula]|nr:uncharacterized protein LOC117827761 isoform X2 [Xyrichtys novacula]
MTAFDYADRGKVPFLTLHPHLKGRMNSKPAVGVSLVVTCISSEGGRYKPFCVCFACSVSFQEALAAEHLDSEKHIMNTLLYLNPWRLPLAWGSCQEFNDLWLAAWEEERVREPHESVMKILDIPEGMFARLQSPSYNQVMMTLTRHCTYLKRGVPCSETCTKLRDNERFPLLGREFLTVYEVSFSPHQHIEEVILCTLCRRKLSNQECWAHVFSRKHIETFINCFHPGSLDSNTDRETLLDLAKQAASHHPVQLMKKAYLDIPIKEPCTYNQTVRILRAAVGRQGQGPLTPEKLPKMKLFPRGTSKDTDIDPVKDNILENSSMVEGPEKMTDEMCADNLIKTEDGAAVPNKQCSELVENANHIADVKNETPNKSESLIVVKEEIQSAGEPCQVIKEERIEVLIMSKPQEEQNKGCEYRDIDLKQEVEEQDSPNPLTLLKNNTCKEETEKAISMSAESQDICLQNNEENNQSLPSNRQTQKITAKEGEGKLCPKASMHQQPDWLWQYLKRTSRAPVIGLQALVECSCNDFDPIYLCECCSMKILEKDIVDHITGVSHMKMFLIGPKRLPYPPGVHQGMGINQFAALFEKHYGYGEAQGVDLNKEVYCRVLTQNFESALQTVKGLQAQQDRVCEPMPTSALSTAQPVKTSLSFHSAQSPHRHNSAQDNYQEVDMEISDLDDSETKPSSVTTSKTAGLAPDSGENVKMSPVEEPGPAHMYSCKTASRKSGETSSHHVSTKEASTTCIHHDSKAEIISNINLRPIKEEEEEVELSQYGDASDTAVMNSTNARKAILEGTTKASSSALESLSRTAAPVVKLTANSSSCTESKLIKSEPSTTSVSATTCKSSTADSNNCAAATISAGDSGLMRTTHSRETDKKCETSTSSYFVKTTQLTAANLKNSTTAATSAPQDNYRAAATNSRETIYKYATSTSDARAATTKSTGTDPHTSKTNNVSKAITNSSTTPSTNSREPVHKNATSSFAVSIKSAPGNKDTRVAAASSAASTNSDRSTAKTCVLSTSSSSSTFKRPASTSSFTPAPPKRTADSFITMSNSTISSSAVVSKPVNMLRPVESRMTVTDKAKRDPTVVSCRPSPAAPSYKTVSSVPTARTSAKCGHAEVLSKNATEEKSVGSNTDAAPCHYNSTAPKDAFKLGLNYLLEVSCGGSRQVYCRLCSSRLRRGGHLMSYRHKYNYVKMKYPEWTARPSEMKSKLAKIVAHLAAIEKDLEPQCIQKVEVNLTVYNQLGLLPEDKAYEKLMGMLRQKDSGVSSSTTDTGEVWTPDAAFSSPFEALSPDDEMGLWQNETARFSPEVHSERESKQVLETQHVAAPENGPVSKEERNLAAGHRWDTAEGSQSLDPEAEPAAATGPPSSVPPRTFKLGSTSPDSHVINTSQEAHEETTQQDKSDPEVQATQKELEGVYPEELASDVPANKEQQNQPRPSQGVKPEQPRCSSRPDNDGASLELPTIRIRDPNRRCSNLSIYLAVKNLKSIGLNAVWECIGLLRNSFYLCESCSERLFINDILKHMISDAHKLNHMRKAYSWSMDFWENEILTHDEKLDLLGKVVQQVSNREHILNMDAQVALLPPDLFELVKTAPFTEALKFVRDFTLKKSFVSPLISTSQRKDQPPEMQQNQAGSQSKETQFERAPETDETNEKDVGQETEKPPLNKVTPREVLSPPDETSVYAEADSDIALIPEADMCLGPKETNSSQSELRSAASQPSTESQVKQTTECSESLSSCSDGTTISLPLTRKRTPDLSVEALARSCTSDPQHEEPLPPKRTCSSLQPSTKSASESAPAASFTSLLLSAQDRNTGVPLKNITLGHLISLVKKLRSDQQTSPRKAAHTKDAETSTSSANSPLEDVVKNQRDPEFEQTTSKVGRWDSEVPLHRAGDGTVLPSANCADPSDQQNNETVDAQIKCAKLSPLIASPECEDTSQNPHPAVNAEPGNREVPQLPINARVTLRSEPAQLQLMGQGHTQGYSVANSGAAHSLPHPGYTQATPAGYNQVSQTASVTNTNTNSYDLTTGATGSVTTSAHPFAYAQNLYQGGGYAARAFYQSLDWGSLDIRKQQQLLWQQQQLMQQQYWYPSWTSAYTARTGTYGTAYQGFSQLSSQQLANFYQYGDVQYQNNPNPQQHDTKQP